MKYIGSPYSDPSKEVRAVRAYKVGKFASYCIMRGHVVYCPITSWHHLAEEHNLSTDFQFWKRLNFQILRFASEMWVLRLDGWVRSVGLAGEMEMAGDLFIPIIHFDGITFERVGR